MRSSEGQDGLASPYRGIQPFRYVDQAYFFGREEMVTALLAKVLVSRLVLLFGESGTGKSSLINAGLIPALEKEGLRPERLRVRPIPEEPILIEKILVGDEDNSHFLPSIFVEDKSVGTNTDSQVVSRSLERFLKTVHEADAYPVLIFDQFEELFTLFAQDRDRAVEEEALQADLLDTIFQVINDENLKAKVIIVIREDFLGKLEILAKKYPQAFDQRVRLQHLDQNGARKAILGPFENTNPFPSQLIPELAGRIIQDLSNSQPNVRIQPTQIQIICSRLWKEYVPTRSEITVQEFEELGGVRGIIEGFLESELAGVEPALRSQAIVILGHLITESGHRDVVSEDRLRGLIALEKDRGREEVSSTPTILEYLEGRRVVYRTARRGTYYYELANEYLIQPIQKEMQQLVLKQERAEAERRARAEEEARTAKIRRGAFFIVEVALLIAALAFFAASLQRDVAVEEAKARATELVVHNTTEAEAVAAQATAKAEANARATEVVVGSTAQAEVEKAATQEAQRAAVTATAAAAELSESYVRQGFAYAKLSDYDQAMADYTKSIELNPDYFLAYLYRGLAYADVGEYDQAITDYTKAIELDPDYVFAYFYRGLAYADVGEYDQAITDYTKAIELNPNFAATYYFRGLGHADVGEYDQAIIDYTKAIELDLDNASTYNSRGFAYNELEEYALAISDFTKAIDLDPNLALAYSNRGWAYSQLENYSLALQDFEKSIELNPDNPWVYYYRGLTYDNLGNRKDAITDLEMGLHLSEPPLDEYRLNTAKATLERLRAPTHTASPTRTPKPTSTVIPSGTLQPIHTPTSTPTKGPTETPAAPPPPSLTPTPTRISPLLTPTSTGTPTPTATPYTLLPAPILITPSEECLDNGSITLRWEWAMHLRNDQLFDVHIHALDCPGRPRSEWPPEKGAWVRDTGYTLTIPLTDLGCNYQWQVVVIQEKKDGTPIEISEPSEERSFWWVISCGPMPTRPPTPTPSPRPPTPMPPSP
jgi:tetratricopeptide (TPR) repeat protein